MKKLSMNYRLCALMRETLQDELSNKYRVLDISEYSAKNASYYNHLIIIEHCTSKRKFKIYTHANDIQLNLTVSYFEHLSDDDKNALQRYKTVFLNSEYELTYSIVNSTINAVINRVLDTLEYIDTIERNALVLDTVEHKSANKRKSSNKRKKSA